jgi:GAF domain-containing protein
MTIQLPPSSDPYPIFEVQNLALDRRFSNLPFVQGGPQLRFYAGTPLTTKRGINIGSLCVMDVEPREGLSLHEARTLGWLAGLVIAHLETTREALEGRRAKLMSHALDVSRLGRFCRWQKHDGKFIS